MPEKKRKNHVAVHNEISGSQFSGDALGPCSSDLFPKLSGSFLFYLSVLSASNPRSTSTAPTLFLRGMNRQGVLAKGENWLGCLFAATILGS